jgi:hypothetical protein
VNFLGNSRPEKSQMLVKGNLDAKARKARVNFGAHGEDLDAKARG